MNIVSPYARMMDVPDRAAGIALLKKIEWAARVSHRSEDAQTDESWERFLTAVVLNHGDWCYDGETEVLADTGWKQWPNVTYQDRLATLSPTGEVQYYKPTRLVQSLYEGEMYFVNGRNVNLLVTPNHRLYICPTSTKEGRKKRSFAFVKAKDLQHQSHAYLKTGRYNADDPITYSQAQFIGFAIGDGYLDTDSDRGSTIRFEVGKGRKIDYLRSICAEASLDFSEKESSKRTCVKFNVSAKNDIQKYLLQIYDKNGDKQIPSALLLSGQRTCLGVLDGLIKSDGNVGKSGISFTTTSQSLARTFQQLCLHAGEAADLTYVLPANRKAAFPNAKAAYRFQVLHRRNTKPEVNKLMDSGQTRWVPWKGEIYCAEVPNNTLYVRRNGKAVWSGNSVTEHEKTTVDAVVDRGVSHEWVRHRMGAYTQSSTRFINYAKKMPPSFIVPVEADHASALSHWNSAIRFAEMAYRQLIADGCAPQIARSVFPNALSTRLVVTYNLRNWRHFLLMRTTKETHPQLREVTIPLLAEFQAKIPLLFDDIEPLALQRENLKKPR